MRRPAHVGSHSTVLANPLALSVRMGKGFTHVDDTERRLVRNMKKEGVSWTSIQKITGRSSDTLLNILAPPKGVKKHTCKGAPKKVPPKVFAKLLKSADTLQKNAGGKKEVTATMVSKHAGVDICDKTLLAEFHKRGFRFYKLKERPLLTQDDMKARLAWAKGHKSRSSEAWKAKPHAIIDNKHFQMFRNAAGRDHVARRSVRGAYQKKGQLPKQHLVKPKKGNMKFPAKGVAATAAVIKGKIRMWEYVGKSWNGEAAAAMYKGPLVKAMAKAYPEQAAKPYAKWTVLEDNDPAGYKASKGVAAKAAAGIVTDDLPPRSPDLNVLDYALWHAINVKMREKEASFPKDKKESEDEFKARLRKTALGLPTTLVKKCVGDMRRRCQKIIECKGGLFTE